VDDIFKGRDVMRKRGSKDLWGRSSTPRGRARSGSSAIAGQHLPSASAKRLDGVVAAVVNYGRIGGLDARGSYHAERAKLALGRALDYFQQHIG
jgi:hypothetical protein